MEEEGAEASEHESGYGGEGLEQEWGRGGGLEEMM